MLGRTFKRYWPWWIVFAWLIGYELWAVATHGVTLSEMVWHASAVWPVLPVVVVPFVVVLCLHFWAGLWK